MTEVREQRSESRRQKSEDKSQNVRFQISDVGSHCTTSDPDSLTSDL
jgi:hypothetical protein